MRKSSREDVVRAVAQQATIGIPVGPLCQRHGISVPTFYRWIKRLNIKLPTGRKIKKKKRNPHVVTLRVQETLGRIVRRNPNLSAKRLSSLLKQEGRSISERSINLYLFKYKFENADQRKLHTLLESLGEERRDKIFELLSLPSSSVRKNKIISEDLDIQNYLDLFDIREKMTTAKEREKSHLGLPYFLGQIDRLILLPYPKRIALVWTIQTLLRYRPFPGEEIITNYKNPLDLSWKFLIKSWLKRAKEKGIRVADINKIRELAPLTPEKVLMLCKTLKSVKSYRVRNANGGWSLQSFPPLSKTKGM